MYALILLMTLEWKYLENSWRGGGGCAKQKKSSVGEYGYFLELRTKQGSTEAIFCNFR